MKTEADFNEVSETIRKELEWFDQQKAQDFKSTFANYLHCMMNYQQQVNSVPVMIMIFSEMNSLQKCCCRN